MTSLIQELKNTIEGFTHLSRDALHIYGGVLFLLLWILLFRGKKVHIGVLVIALMAIFNEYVDIKYHYDKYSSIKWGPSFSDVFNTVFLPFIIYLRYHLPRKK